MHVLLTADWCKWKTKCQWAECQKNISDFECK